MIISERIAHDQTTVKNILLSLGDIVPTNVKFTRLGKPCATGPRPLKATFVGKESVITYYLHLTWLNNSALFSEVAKQVTKHALQRKLLKCHVELDQRVVELVFVYYSIMVSRKSVSTSQKTGSLNIEQEISRRIDINCFGVWVLSKLPLFKDETS